MSLIKYLVIASGCVFYSTLGLAADIIGDTNAGQAKAAACAACHGPKGINATGGFPNLAGQNEVYIVNSLKAFRDKKREAEIMNTIAAALDDQDIANLAAYYNGLTSCP